MDERSSYKNAMESIGSNAVITVESLEQRKKCLQKKRIKQGACMLALCGALLLAPNAAQYVMAGEVWIKNALHITNANGAEVDQEEAVDPETGEVEMISVEFAADADTEYYVQEDGRLYFSFEGQKEDITEACTGDNFYAHEYYDEKGQRHVIVIGCTDGTPGSAEYMFAENGYVFCQTYDLLNVPEEEKECAVYLLESPMTGWDIRYERGKTAWMANAEVMLGLNHTEEETNPEWEQYKK